MNRVIREHTFCVCSRKYPQGSVVSSRVVEMHTQSQYLCKSFGWCVRIHDSFFDGPWSPPGCVCPPLERQGRVLMPDDQPVRVWRLIKQRGSIGNGRFAENCAHHSEQPRIFSDLGNSGMLHSVANASARPD